MFQFQKATGHHEVLIESPVHTEHPAKARVSQLTYVIQAYRDRVSELSSKSYVKFISIFRNHGREAGASLAHPHSQIIALPIIPRNIQEELKKSQEFWKRNDTCFFCTLLEEEKDSPRFIFQNKDFLIFSPWAGIDPMGFWIIPKDHAANLLEMTQSSIKYFIEAFQTSLQALHQSHEPHGVVPYSYGFHFSIDPKNSQYYHWHLEVYPKLSVHGGFEKSTGIYINAFPPEISAEILRKTLESNINVGSL
jgi:UDPglucose--hexose-1-phosphate uridylyltransferase